jgi:outer membrane protein TolC
MKQPKSRGSKWKPLVAKSLWAGISAAGLLSLFYVASAKALSLDEYLAEVRKSHPVFESVDLAKQASELRKAQNELGLSPILSSQLSYFHDRKPPGIALQPPGTDATDWNLGVAKKFATGTGIQVQYDQQKQQLFTRNPLTGQLVKGAKPTYADPYIGTLSVSASQSLWKDGFGRGTRIRRERDDIIARTERLGAELEARQILIAAEQAYWDYVFSREDNKIRKESLQRAQKIGGWAETRAENRLSDRSDLLQVRALVASRELQAIGAEDDLKVALKKLGDLVNQPELAAPPYVSEEFARSRPLTEIVGTSDPKEVTTLPARLKDYEAQVKENVARDLVEQTRPDLSLEGQYAMNARRASPGKTLQDTFNNDTPTAAVALKFSLNLDQGGVSDARAAADADARALRIRAARLRFEAESSWSELVRRHGELTKRVDSMRQLVKIQREKTAREQERLRNGRTTTFQAVTFEQDAADAESQLLKLQVEQKKLEAQARIFATEGALESL